MVHPDDQRHHKAQPPDYATCCAHGPLLPDWLNVRQACRVLIQERIKAGLAQVVARCE